MIYSFHLYEPPELTALGAYRPGLDAAAMARLPFPVTDPAPCEATAAATADAPTADLMRFYCAQRWDAEGRRADRRGRRLGAAPSRCCAGRRVRRLAAAECNRASRLAHRGAQGLRAAGDRLGAVGLRRLDGFRSARQATRALDPGLLRALGWSGSTANSRKHVASPTNAHGCRDVAVNRSVKEKPPVQGPGASKQGGFTSGRRRGHRPPSGPNGPEHWREHRRIQWLDCNGAMRWFPSAKSRMPPCC